MAHKCFRCGTEFEGNFCPECGTKWEEEKTCPQCGATLPGNAKFCNECGYSFLKPAPSSQVPAGSAPTTPARASRPASPEKSGKGLLTLYTVSRFLPAALLAVFSVLLFLLCLAPAAVMPGGELFGETIPSESLGSVYEMLSGEIVPSLKGCCVSLIVFASLMVAVSTGVLLFREKRIVACYVLGYAFLFAIFIVSCAMFVIIGKEDEGMGMLAAGSAPILILVFSLLFGLLAAAALGIQLYVKKSRPEILESYRSAHKTSREKKEERLQKFFATHPVPVEPEKMEKPKKPHAYYHDTVPEEKRAGLMPELEKHIKKKRMIASLLALLLSISGILALFFTVDDGKWSGWQTFPFILYLVVPASICLVWSKKKKINGWHPEKVYKYRGLKAAIITCFSILFSGALIYVYVMTSWFVSTIDRYYENKNIQDGQYISTTEDSDHLFLSYHRNDYFDESNYLIENSGSILSDNKVRYCDEDCYFVYKLTFDLSKKANLYDFQAGRAVEYGKEISFSEIKTECEVSVSFLSDFNRKLTAEDDEWYTKEWREKNTTLFYFYISSDGSNWTKITTDMNVGADSRGGEYSIKVDDYLKNFTDTIYLRFEDVLKKDGHGFSTGICEIDANATCEYLFSFPWSLADELWYDDGALGWFISSVVSTIFLTISCIVIVVLYRKTAKKRIELCMKLCAAKSPQKSEQLCESYRRDLAEYKNQYAKYEQNRRDWIVYRYELARYRKGKPYYANTPYSHAWFYTHKWWLAGGAILLAGVITLTCILATMDRRFSVDNLMEIGLGAYETEVVEVLGEPDKKTETEWYYYSKDYISLMDDMRELEEQSMNANSLEELAKLEQEYEELEKELAELEYKKIVVRFASQHGSVNSLTLDTCATEGNVKEKEAEEVTISSTYTHTISHGSIIFSRYNYTISYTDGSYRMGFFTSSQLPTTAGDDQEITWSDEWGTYTATIDVYK